MSTNTSKATLDTFLALLPETYNAMCKLAHDKYGKNLRAMNWGGIENGIDECHLVVSFDDFKDEISFVLNTYKYVPYDEAGEPIDTNDVSNFSDTNDVSNFSAIVVDSSISPFAEE